MYFCDHPHDACVRAIFSASVCGFFFSFVSFFFLSFSPRSTISSHCKQMSEPITQATCKVCIRFFFFLFPLFWYCYALRLNWNEFFDFTAKTRRMKQTKTKNQKNSKAKPILKQKQKWGMLVCKKKRKHMQKVEFVENDAGMRIKVKFM